MNDTIEVYKKQHIENYKNAIKETINNNTDVLINEDMMLLLKKPPLDSMDLIKVKCLDIAKKNKILVDTEKVDKMLSTYRKHVITCCDEIKMLRVNSLVEVLDKTNFSKETDVFRFTKKIFNDTDKKIKKILKDQLLMSLEKDIVPQLSKIFIGEIDETLLNKVTADINKYIKGPYLRQLLENMDFKMLVKDTTLMNLVKEQNERYLFTLTNSRIFQQNNV